MKFSAILLILICLAFDPDSLKAELQEEFPARVFLQQSDRVQEDDDQERERLGRDMQMRWFLAMEEEYGLTAPHNDLFLDFYLPIIVVLEAMGRAAHYTFTWGLTWLGLRKS